MQQRFSSHRLRPGTVAVSKNSYLEKPKRIFGLKRIDIFFLSPCKHMLLVLIRSLAALL